MKEEHHFISARVYGVILLCIIIGFAAVYAYSARLSGTVHTYSFDKDTLGISQDGIGISVMVSKSWDDNTLHPDIPVGAQYDGVLTNNSRYLFENWRAELIFSEDAAIDSSWNGEFSVSGPKVTFAAEDDPAHVAAFHEATFGAVMYSTQIMELESCVISGFKIVKMTDLPAFWLLISASFFWLMALIGHIVVSARVAHFRERQKLDGEIIKQSMNTFTGFIDAKDAYTRGHSMRVAAYSSEIARRMKMSAGEVERLYYITLMHDCGKIGIPDSVLKKPGTLTAEEFDIIKSHTTLGDAILVNFTAIPGIRDGAHYHHERFDGKGYPAGLKGTDIPLYARIICVADSYDAMSSNRCYRRRLNTEKILAELKDNAGKQFDPDIVKYMIDMINDGFVQKVQAETPGASDDMLNEIMNKEK